MRTKFLLQSFVSFGEILFVATSNCMLVAEKPFFFQGQGHVVA
jgi:hypothetical protein